jgi:hypothetical protein
MKKRMIILILSIVCSVGMSISAAAGTISFDITVTEDGAGSPDPNSYKEVKDDYDPNYYVTCTGMNNSRGRITYQSVASDHSTYSNWGSHSYNDLNKTKTIPYDAYAPAGKLYYLHGLNAANPSATYYTLNVTGRYCP